MQSLYRVIKYSVGDDSMLHNEARKLVLEAWDKTHNAKEIAKYFSVNESTIYRLVEERTRIGSYETRTYLRGRKPILQKSNTRIFWNLYKNNRISQ